MVRREFLRYSSLMMGSAVLPLSLKASFWTDERHLWIVRKETREEFKGVYYKSDNYQKESYARICTVLRDVRADQAVAMDPVLMDLLYAVQRRMSGMGIITPLYIHSGYRSEKTNASIEGAAKNSFHLKGKAVDFSVDKFDATLMGMFAAEFKAGGVGFYPGRDFIHMDTGSVRYWVS